MSWLRKHRLFVKGIATLVVVGFILFAAPGVLAVGDGNLASTIVGGVGGGLAATLAWIIDWLTRFLGSLITLIMQHLLLPVLKYSNFINHPVVKNGWEIVRNLTNTGFVALMLVIAFGTMFGVSKVSWQQNIPKLVIAAIAVNFSRLIVGLFIDIGQVVMIAFVNALQQVGIANLLELTKMRQATAFTSQPGGLATGGIAFSLFASSIFAFIQMAITLVVLVVMIGVLIYRIVIIWVLIIMAPAAFLAGAAQSVLSKAGSFYSDWWGKLTAAVMIGPVLAFFLWLSLASVGQLTENFNPENQPTGGTVIVNQSADPNDLLGYIIGIALLIAGLEIAGQSASALGGFASQIVSGGSGLAKKIAGAPVSLGVAGGLAAGRFGLRKTKEGARATGLYAADVYRGSVAEDRQHTIDRLQKAGDRNIARGGVFAMYGKYQKGKGAKMDEEIKTRQAEIAKREAGFMGTSSTQEKLNFYNANKDGRETNRVRSMGVASSIVTDEKAFAELMRTDPKTAGQMLKDVQDHHKTTGDEKGKESIDRMLDKNIQWKYGTAGEMSNALSGMTEAEIKKLDPRVWESSTFREAARGSRVFDRMLSTNGDDADRNRARGGYSRAHLEAMDRMLDPTEDDGAGGRMANPNLGIDQDEQTRYQDANDALSRADMSQQVNLDASRSNEAAHQMINGMLTNTLNDVLKSGLRLENVDLNALRGTAGFDEAHFAEILADAMQRSGGSAVLQSVHDSAAATNTNVDERARAQEMLRFMTTRNTMVEAARLATGNQNRENMVAQNRSIHEANAASFGFNPATPNAMAAAERRTFATQATNDPTLLVRIEGNMASNGGNNDLVRSFAEALKTQSLDGYLKNFEKSIGTPQQDTQRRILDAVGRQVQRHAANVQAAPAGTYSADASRQADELLEHFRRRIATQYDSPNKPV